MSRIKRLPRGKVNVTFHVQTTDKSYILQRLHPSFGVDGGVVANLAEVKDKLRGIVRTPDIVPTNNGSLWVVDDGLWRMMTVLPGRPPASRSPEIAAEAYRVLGMFHRALKINPPRLFHLPAAEHNRDGPAPPEAWDKLMSENRLSSCFDQARPALEKGRALVARLPRIKGVSIGVLHGDPKLDNFLFDENGVATGIVDLDLVRRGYLIWELADGLRSWVSIRASRDTFTLGTDIFNASVASYKIHGLELCPEEWELLPAATMAVALNLARRYFQDFFEHAYFVWDQAEYPSLAEQNLSRGTALLGLAEQLLENEQKLRALIRS
ncbi:MAG: phosphotransferase [Deltaproteobacteria bacterium]|nr:phosphotransferase [Deltaproteobacteria bacterium]